MRTRTLRFENTAQPSRPLTAKTDDKGWATIIIGADPLTSCTFRLDPNMRRALAATLSTEADHE